MSLHEKHQTFQRVVETAGIPFDYYKLFSPQPFSCTQHVRLIDMGYKDASRGDVGPDFLDNSVRPERTEAARWGVFQYVLGGKMRFIDHGRERIVEPGEAALFTVPSKTSYHDPDSPDAQWFFVTFCGQTALSVVDEIITKNGPVLSGLEHSRLLPVAAQLFSMALAHVPPPFFEFSAELYRLLMELGIEVLSYRKNYPEPIAYALELMDHHFGDSTFSLDRISETVGLSKYYFSRLFREHVKESPGAYLQQKRMQMAMDLLLHSNQPVKEIQYLCGYTNYSYFMTAFRKVYGMPPGAARSH
ncbi:MAG: AraC family transcriptional regulator [Kiritimatiellales bacterium]|nr:AraC family transcriptional regulator [Kiritimatiellales bacterium]